VFSTPTVVGDVLFIGSCAGNFYAIDKTTGALQWSYDIKKDGWQTSFHGNPLVTDDLILIGTDRSCDPKGIGHVYAFELQSGKVRWKYQTTSVPTEIIRVGENIFFGSFQDHWSAINLQTGKLVWDFSTGLSNEGCTFVKSPVAHEANVYLIGLDGIIYSLDAKSGRLVWKRKLPASPSTALLMKDKSLFVGTTDKHIYRLKSQTGEIEAETSTEAQPVGRLTWADNAIVSFLENKTERSGNIVSISSDLSKINWTQKQSPEWASERPHVKDGLVLAGNCRGELAAFRLSDGARQWKVTLKGCIRSIGSSNGTFFVGAQEGTVYALRN